VVCPIYVAVLLQGHIKKFNSVISSPHRCALRIRLSTSSMSFFEFVCFYLMKFAFSLLLRHPRLCFIYQFFCGLEWEPLAEGYWVLGTTSSSGWQTTVGNGLKSETVREVYSAKTCLTRLTRHGTNLCWQKLFCDADSSPGNFLSRARRPHHKTTSFQKSERCMHLSFPQESPDLVHRI
jgi:hypothetical protein